MNKSWWWNYYYHVTESHWHTNLVSRNKCQRLCTVLCCAGGESRNEIIFIFYRGARKSIDEKWPSTLIRVTYVFIPFMAH